MSVLSPTASLKLAAAIGVGLLLTTVWWLYQNPALSLVLGMVRFCG